MFTCVSPMRVENKLVGNISERIEINIYNKLKEHMLKIVTIKIC